MAAVAPKLVFYPKQITLLTKNTWEALQCVRLYQRAPEGACHPLKVMTLARPNIFELTVLYVGVYGGTEY